MSYDIKIWSIIKAQFPKSLPKENWKLENNNAYLEKNDWQIVINESSKIEDEDISQEVIPLLPGISYLTELNLEPSNTPEFAKKLLLKISKSIAKDVIGVIEDPQNESIIAPSGIKRFIPPKRDRNERFSVLEMSWCFINNQLSNEKIISKLVDYFESKLPEALPRRYGEYEPPQYKYTETGKEFFKKYLLEQNNYSIVWYPTKPVVNVSFSLQKDWGIYYARGKKFFASNNVSLEFDEGVLNQAGWKEHLQKVFKDISMIIEPFYGEVRILRNQIYGRGTYFSDQKSEESPVSTGRWKGIPMKLGQAIVVGNPYLQYLPKVTQRGSKFESLCFLSTDDWKSEKTINNIIGDVPKEIAQIKPNTLYMTHEEALKRDTEEEQFPPIFPFTKEIKK